jgi:hypothetical protein
MGPLPGDNPGALTLTDGDLPIAEIHAPYARPGAVSRAGTEQAPAGPGTEPGIAGHESRAAGTGFAPASGALPDEDADRLPAEAGGEDEARSEPAGPAAVHLAATSSLTLSWSHGQDGTPGHPGQLEPRHQLLPECSLSQVRR